MPTIDNKIVQMTFDNKQFEKGVAESLKTLEDLKRGLELDKAVHSLENLERAANNFDISGIARGVDSIADKFTLVGKIGQEVFDRISKFAVDKMQQVVGTITSMPRTGLNKYEQKNKAVQMIQSAMPEKSLEEIEEVLGRLNEYTDWTSYDFATMAQSIGKFTSAGIDLEVAERAMEGIANEAASAGGEIWQANIAMYNFSQALATGSVKLMDWHSIENQNLATKEFKEQIIETAYELGVLGKVDEYVGKTAKGTTVTFENFAQTLSEGWFNSDVLINVLEKYADTTTEVGRKGFEAAKVAITLQQAFEAVKDAISSGWMESFVYIFGNLEEASKLFTRVSDALIDFAAQFSEYRNWLLGGWHEGIDGVSGYTEAIEALSDVWNIFTSLVEAARNAITDVFGVFSPEDLIAITVGIRNITSGLREVFGLQETIYTRKRPKNLIAMDEELDSAISKMEKFDKTLSRGMSGDEIKRMQQYLMDLGDETIKLDQYGADGIFGPETQAAVKAFQKSVGLEEDGIFGPKTQEALSKTMKVEGDAWDQIEHKVTTMAPGLQNIQKIIHGVISVVKIGANVFRIALGIVGGVLSMLAPVGLGLLSIAGGLGDVISFFAGFVDSLTTSEFWLGAFNTLLGPIATGLQIVGDFLTSVGDGISKVAEVAKTATSFENIGEILNLDPEANAAALMVYNFLTKIKEAAEALKPFIDTFRESVGNFFKTIGEWVGSKITTGLTAIGDFFTNLWNSIKEGQVLEKILSGLAIVLQVIVGVIGGVGFGIFAFISAIINGAKAIWNFVVNSELMTSVLEKIKTFTAPIREFFTSIWNALGGMKDKIKNMKSFSDIFDAFIANLDKDAIGKKFSKGIKKVISPLTNIGKTVSSVTDYSKKMVSFIREKGGVQEAIDAFVAMDPEKYGREIKILTFLQNIQNFFKQFKPYIDKARTAISTAFSKIFSTGKVVGGSIWESIKNFFKMDEDKSLGENIQAKFEELKTKLKEKWDGVVEWFNGIVENSPFLSALVPKLESVKNDVISFGKTLLKSLGDFFGFGEETGRKRPHNYVALGMEEFGEEEPKELTFLEQLKQRLHAFDPVIDWITEKANQIKEALFGEDSLVGRIKKAFSEDGLFGAVTEFFTKVGDTAKGVKLDQAFDAAKSIFVLYILGSIALALRRFSATAAVLTGAKNKKGQFADSLLKMAISIVMVVAALAVLSTMDLGKVFLSVFAVGLIFGALAAVSWALSTFADGTKVRDAGIGIAAMAAGLLLVVISIAAMSALISAHSNNPWQLVLSVVVVGLILAALYAVAKSLAATSGFGIQGIGGAAIIVAMCLGLLAVVGAIRNLTELFVEYIGKPLTLIAAIGVIALLIAEIGAIAVAISNAKGFGASIGGALIIAAICLGLLSVVGAVERVTNMIDKFGGEDVAGAFGWILGAIFIIGAIATAISALGKGSGLSMLLGGGMFVGMFWSVSQIIDALKDIMPKIQEVDTEKLKIFFDGLEAVILEIGLAVAAVTAIPFTGWLKLAGGLAALGAAFAAVSGFVGGGVDALTSALWLVGTRLKRFSKNMDQVTLDNATKAKDFITIMLGIFGDAAIKGFTKGNEIDEVTSSIIDIGSAIANCATSLSGIPEDDVTTRAKSIVDSAVDIATSIDGLGDTTRLRKTLEGVSAAVSLYYGNIAGIEFSDAEPLSAKTLREAFQALSEAAPEDLSLDKFAPYADNGEKASGLTDFAEGIVNIATAINKYGTSLADVDPDKITLANSVLETIDSIQTATTGVSLDFFNGLFHFETENGLDQFILDVGSLGSALSNYATDIGGLNYFQVLKANAVLQSIAGLEIKSTNSVFDKFTGNVSLSQFATNMGDVGDGIAEFANAVFNSNFDKINIDEALKPITQLASIELPKEGGVLAWFAGEGGLTGLGTGYKSFAGSLLEMQGTLKELNMKDGSKLQEAFGVISQVINMQKEIPTDLNNWSALERIGQAIESFMGSLGRVYNGRTESGQNGEDLVAAGLEVAGYLLDGIIDGVSESGDRLAAALSIVFDAGYSEYYNHATSFESIGKFIVDGLARGITNNSSVATTAVENLMASVVAKAKAVPEVESPSKVFAWIGHMIDEGLAGGLLTYSGLVEDASGSVADSAIEGARTGLSSYVESIMNGVDDSPVIRPVLDLSEVGYGVGLMNGMFGGTRSIGVTSGSLASRIGSGSSSNASVNQNSSNAAVISAINAINDRVDRLGEAISGLQVVVDSGALVGQISSKMDVALGNKMYTKRRLG